MSKKKYQPEPVGYPFASPSGLILGPIGGTATMIRRDVLKPSLDRCDKCRGTEFTDVKIHGGRSMRRDCNTGFCRRTWGFSLWYGATE